MLSHVIIAGIGTDVGKTVVAAIFSLLLRRGYWKPVECGNDTEVMRSYFDLESCPVYLPAYTFRDLVSPHLAAWRAQKHIELDCIRFPTQEPLVIEMAGGVMTPLSTEVTNVQLMQKLDVPCVLVSRNYLGSINHTLLSVELLREKKVPILGIIFNGETDPYNERVILDMTNLPCLGKISREETINYFVIQRYATQWKEQVLQLLI